MSDQQIPSLKIVQAINTPASGEPPTPPASTINHSKRALYLIVAALTAIVPQVPAIASLLHGIGAPAWAVTLITLLPVVFKAFMSDPSKPIGGSGS